MSAATDLLAWYDQVARDLPWRRTADPYRILVSEVMLQQTRVETVLRFYERFLAAFPSVEALAVAPAERVLERWSGLGYYRRARQLQATARAVVARGAFPRRASELAELPGIGEYTAAAVASIAFGEATPVLDGNVARVVARLRGHQQIAGALARRQLRQEAAALLDAGRAGDSNQALMELGATVCTPRQPRCGLCPLSPSCAARLGGAPESLPQARARPAPTRVRHVAALARDDAGRVLLVGGSRGLWEVPQVAIGTAASPAAGPVLAAAGETVEGALARGYGGDWSLAPARTIVRHGVTRFVLEVAVHEARLAGTLRVPAGWFAVDGELAVSALVRKVLRAAPAPG